MLSLIAYTFWVNQDFVFFIIVQSMMSANARIRFGLQIVFVCLRITPLSIIILQTYLKKLNLQNVCQIYFVEWVSEIKHIPSVIHYTIYGAVCFQLTHIPHDDWENVYTLSYYHHQIGSMHYYPLFRVRSWDNGMRCMSLFILTKNTDDMEIFPCFDIIISHKFV